MSGTPLLPRSTHETPRSDLYFWATGNTLGALGCTAAGVILGVRTGLKALPVSLFAMAGICGLNAAKGWYDVNRERVRIQTQSERAKSEGTYLQALETIAGSLESKTSITADPVFANTRATRVWNRIKRSLPGLFAPPPSPGPTEAEIRSRIDAAVIRALQGVIDQLGSLFPDRIFPGKSPSETLTAMIAAIRAEVQKPKLGDEGDQLAAARESLSEKDTRLAEQESVLLQERQIVRQVQQELASAGEKHAALQQEFLTAQARVAELEGQLSAKNASSEDQDAGLRDELQAAQAKASALETQKRESNVTIARLTGDCQSAQRALYAAKTDLVAALTAQQKTQEQHSAALEAQAEIQEQFIAASTAKVLCQAQCAAELATQAVTHQEQLAAAATRAEMAEGQMSTLQQQVQSQTTELKDAKRTIREIEAWSPQLVQAMRDVITRLQDPEEAQIYTFTLPPVAHPLYSLVVKVNELIEHANSISIGTDSSSSLNASTSTPERSPPSSRAGSRSYLFGTPTSPGDRALTAALANLPREEAED